MKYLAHINDYGQEQTLKDHLEGTAQLCAEFAERFGAYDMGYCCGLLHDIGKYALKFQERLHGSEVKVDHSTAGAQLCWEKDGAYGFLSYCIAGHHAGLPDTGGEGDTPASGTIFGRMKKKTEPYQAYQTEIDIPLLTALPFQPVQTENFGFFTSMLIRMLYSCLVDADFLDTEFFMKQGASFRDCGASIDVLEEKLQRYIMPWLENQNIHSLNGRRTEILKNCIKQGQKAKGLYKLTVPTGGGKTISSLAFALTHAKKHKMDRVIYVIPYTSIIEQTAGKFSEILGKENVLENHCNVDYDADEELKPMHLAAENWDKPVVVTTNVQFFESMFSAKSSKCRKLHNIANSVIVFDEAQMLPNAYLRPCIAVMEQLIRYYQSTIVLCTATQPALQNLMAEDVYGNARELCPRMEEQFQFFKRVTIQDLGKLSEDVLVQQLEAEQQALCIVNTRKRAQHIFQNLKGSGIYHLSTTMYPVHRKKVLDDIRKRLKEGKRCIVVSTSLVEAGVDLDFRTVYRQLSGIDSMIQAAGRCNREGHYDAKDSFTYIFRLEDREYLPGQRQQIDISECLLDDGRALEEPETIQAYFDMLYHIKGESLDKKKIMDAFRNNRFSFAEVSKKFQVIERNTKTVLVPKELQAKNILSVLKEQGMSKQRIREMGRYCVNIYDTEFQKMYAAGIIQPISEDMQEDCFVLEDMSYYTDETGFCLDVGYGEAVLW